MQSVQVCFWKVKLNHDVDLIALWPESHRRRFHFEVKENQDQRVGYSLAIVNELFISYPF